MVKREEGEKLEDVMREHDTVRLSRREAINLLGMGAVRRRSRQWTLIA